MLLAAPAVQAQIYKWVDEHGDVHFTDTPPPGQSHTEVKEADPRRQATSERSQDEKKAIDYKGEKPSRRLMLEEVNLDLPYRNGETQGVARAFSGYHCKLVEEVRAQGHESLKVARSFARAFHRLLAAHGYARPDETKASTSRSPKFIAELSMVGSVTAAEVKTCTGRWAGGKRAPRKDFAKFRVDWRVYDNLTQDLLYEQTTEGAHDRWNRHYRRDEQTGVEKTTEHALLAAASRLLADPEFVDLLDPQSTLLASAPAAASEADVSELVLQRALPTGSFQSRLSSLKAGTVTVRTLTGHGSGFLLSGGGHVLTNHHVIEDSSRVVAVFGTAEIQGTVLATDRHRDVALIKLDRVPDAEALALGSIQTGETVYVIGTPLEEALSHTVTRGIISAERRIKGMDFYQTDANVHPGNSGGPAFNERGEVIGIAVAGIVDAAGKVLGINYLIPIEPALEALGVQP